MERLTKRLPSDTAVPSENWIPTTYEATCQELAQRLADYEDAEEQGRLMVLPVARGSTVYYVPDYLYGQDSRIEELYVMGYRIFEDDSIYLRVKATRFSGTLVNIKRIGNNVFLTREEAETKRKELEGNNAEDH